MKNEIILIGGGGHGRSLLGILDLLKLKPTFILESNPKLFGEKLFEIEILDENEFKNKFELKKYKFINGVGALTNTEARKKVFEDYKAIGAVFLTIISPLANVSKYAKVDEGVQIFNGAYIGPNGYVGANSIVNTGAIVEHDVKIGPHSLIGPGGILCGGSVVGSESLVGAGSIIIPGKEIGNSSLTAAGSVVTKNFLESAKLKGIPAEKF